VRLLSNIAEVSERELCTGCGTCAALCPKGAISMVVQNGIIQAGVDANICSGCGICLRCCSGITVDLEGLSEQVFGKQPDDPDVGNYLECYVGFSNDEGMRNRSTSGGVVTHLIIYALDKGIIDGALVTKMDKENPKKSVAFVARTREEVISASRARYCPVTFDKAIALLRKERGKFAIVGLPCQVHSIRMAEKLFPDLRNKIALHVGLFCSHMVSFDGTENILGRLDLGDKELVSLDYRAGKLPDYMFVTAKNGRTFKVRYSRGWKAYWNVFAPYFFTPLRCLMCPDALNEFSDISVGDAWIPEFRKANSGRSIVVVRTEPGRRLLSDMREKKLLSMLPVPVSKVKQSQDFTLNFKKTNIGGRVRFLTLMGKTPPYLKPELESSGILGLINGSFSYISYYFSCRKELRHALRFVPLPLFRLYFSVFRILLLVSKAP
jgi:coenzyme F420 hydrogenase subunit beta